MKKTGLALLLAAAILLTGCSSRDYRAAAEAQRALAELTSAKLTVTATAENADGADSYRTDFTFCYLADGALQFCQTQYDGGGKAVYCAYSAGTDVEQWLIGEGWETLTGAGYTRAETHRYLRLLSTPYTADEVASTAREAAEDGVLYTLTLDPEALNRGRYADGETAVVSETVTVCVSAEGRLTGYTEAAVFRDKETGAEQRYRLEIAVSGHDDTPPLPKPSLRDYQL